MEDTRISGRFLRNSVWLFGGNGVGALLGVASTALAARLLGPAEFGLMALITVYANINDRLFNFQTWQALIRFGARAIENDDRAGLRKLVKLCVLLDVAGASLGAAVAFLAAGPVSKLLQFDDSAARLLAMFSIVIAFKVVGSSTGILRLFDRFSLLSAHNVLLNVLVLAGTAAMWQAGAGLAELLLVLAVSQAIANLALFGWAWRTLAAQDYHSVAAEPLRGVGKAAPDIFRFLFWTNIESSVKILRELDVFIVKALLDVEAVGLYQVARRIAQLFELAVAPFTFAIYPEFSRQIARGDRAGFVKLLRTSALIVGSATTVAWIGFLLFGETVLRLAFGEVYVGSYEAAVLCALGSTIWAWAQPISPAMFSFGLADRAFRVHLAVAILYLCAVWPMTNYAGLAGAGAAYALFHLVWSVAAGVVVLGALQRQKHGRSG